VPVTLGFLKPVILLPVAMITHLTTRQVEAILVHELAHIRRKDYLINLLVTVTEMLFFFNPFARMLIGQLKKEREHCCDDLVLQFQYEPHTYVSALLSLARQHRQGQLAVAATGGGDNQLLLQRAKRILHQKRTDERPGARPLFLLLLTMGMTLLVWGPRQAAPSAQPERLASIRPAGIPQSSIDADNRTIVNSLPSNVRLHPQTPAGHITISHAAIGHAAPTHAKHRAQAAAPLTSGDPDNSVSWYNTSGPSKTPSPAYADLVIIDSRDYSIGSPSINDQAPPAPPVTTEGFPFVPQASFSFQSTDTLPPEDRLAMMQMATEKAIKVQMGRLREELKIRVNELQAAEQSLNKASKNRALSHSVQSASRQQLNQLIHDQLLLQQQYLLKVDSLRHQLQLAIRRLTTVYI
jgi:hypothetical protein